MVEEAQIEQETEKARSALMTGSVDWARRGPGTGSAVDRALRAAAATVPSAEEMVIDPGSTGTTFVWRDLERRTALLAGHIEDFAAARAGGLFAVEVVAGRTASALLWLVAALRTDLPVVLLDPSAPDQERHAVREGLLGAGVDLVRPASGEGFVDNEGPLAYLPAIATAGKDATVPRHALVLGSGGGTGGPKLIVDTTLRRSATHERLGSAFRVSRSSAMRSQGARGPAPRPGASPAGRRRCRR